MQQDGRNRDGRDILDFVWALGGGDARDTEAVTLTGVDPVLPSSYRVGALAQGTISAAALAAASLHRARGGPMQEIGVDMLHAASEFLSERQLLIDGNAAPHLWDDIAGVYPCGDGRSIRLHTNFEHHRNGILKILDCAYNRDAVGAALRQRNAFDVEEQAAAAGVVCYALRTEDEWAATEQAIALNAQELVSIERIETSREAPPRQRSKGEQPLSDIRVLDLTRIIAGPVCGRTLAAHGADVLRVTGPHLPFVPLLIIDAGRGKRSAHIDLRDDDERARLMSLAGNADVFVQGYRPGAIAARGFDARSVAEKSPGIVYVSLCAWGYEGPWRERRGYDSLVQSASGINLAESTAAGADTPGELPCQALDHASGYLMAFGAMRALEKQATEGGSWHVRVSLARTGKFLSELGRVSDGSHQPHPDANALAPYLAVEPSGFGALTHVTHSAQLSQTPAHWHWPSTPLGAHKPRWEDFSPRD